MKTNSKIALLAAGAGAALLWLMRKQKATSGIGAAKRRIFKELSLAQKAGVDFTKKYDELDEREIKALEKVSSDTGYTETYYKSLKKAYDAVSGIGTTYDVKDADGNTVLTWTDAPGANYVDDSDRWRALREAHDIEDDRMWATENAAQLLAEREARLAEQRKRIKKAGRSSQMALFGIGYTDEVEAELYEIWREQLEYGNTERDYDSWRLIYGDEFAKTYVLPYIH